MSRMMGPKARLGIIRKFGASGLKISQTISI
jgi:hypothetical protein